MSRIVAAFILLVAASAAFAQDRDEAADAALERAVEALRSGVFHFEYDVSLQDGRITGSGYGDRNTNTWEYTVQGTPPTANDGERIISGGAYYRNGAPAGPDFTNNAITGGVAPFDSYDDLSWFDGFTPLSHLGTVEVDGVPAEHYSFAVKDNFLYGTATFELFLTETDAGVERIILETTPAGQEPNRVTYTRIGEIINVQTP